MSLYDYNISNEIIKKDYPFYALLMALMRKADYDNILKLRAEWPDVWEELQQRYWVSGGTLPEDSL